MAADGISRPSYGAGSINRRQGRGERMMLVSPGFGQMEFCAAAPTNKRPPPKRPITSLSHHYWPPRDQIWQDNDNLMSDDVTANLLQVTYDNSTEHDTGDDVNIDATLT